MSIRGLLFFTLVFSSVSFLHAKTQKHIYGKIVGSSGVAVRDAMVVVGMSKVASPTNISGAFVIKAAVGDTLHVFSNSCFNSTWIVPATDKEILFPQITLQLRRRVWVRKDTIQSDLSDDQIWIAGRVINDLLQPMAGVNVALAHRLKGTVTNELGSFQLLATIGDTLDIRSVGFKKQRFVLTKEADNLFREVMLEIDTVMLAEIKVMPWLTKDMMSYENLPLDATEIGNMYLRYKGMMTDKTRFPTISYNFAPFLGKLFGLGIDKIRRGKLSKKEQRIDLMRQRLLLDEQRARNKQDSLHSIGEF